jgi:hypothetical protein
MPIPPILHQIGMVKLPCGVSGRPVRLISRGSLVVAVPAEVMEIPAPTVTFQVERFEWTAGDRLELVGRWFGLRGQRFLRPTLDVEVDGHSRRLLALLDHKPWVAGDGEEWVAAFAWDGDPIDFTEAELAVAPDLAVELPSPAGPPPASKAPARDGAARPRPRRAPQRVVERRSAGPPRAQRLERELGAAVAEVERLTTELDRAHAAHAAQSEELQRRLTGERQSVRKLAGELRTARERLGAAETTAGRRLQQLRELERELDAARSARESALAEAEKQGREREMALRDRAAAEHERDAAVRARDRARMERNAWLSRARAARTERQPLAPEENLTRQRPVGPR